MKKLQVIALALLAAIMVLTGCQDPINPGQTGTLTVSMNDAVSRSMLPGISMNPASYELVGTGPNGASFNTTVANGGTATVTGLVFGDWTVIATARNSGGTAIGQGSGMVTVLSNASVNLSITVRPYEGFGTLALSVSWPAAKVQTAQIQSTLTSASGAPRSLNFSIDSVAGTASFNANDIATGYHTLVLKLLDNGHLAIGAVEVVRIVKGQTTGGSIEFTDINEATGNLVVNLTPDMGDPLDVSINGAVPSKPKNQSLALGAAVSNYQGNVTYVWYVNGDAAATGQNFSFNETWEQGYYRIDVTAYSADGKRAGSDTIDVRVVDEVAGNVNYISPNIGTLIYVPAGRFQRDATATNISVITRPYRMSQCEITRSQYLSIMGVDPSLMISSGLSDPVQGVNFYEAVEFCNKLSVAESLTPVYTITNRTPTTGYPIWSATVSLDMNANGYRLPTEMEWMWAAMGAPVDGRNGSTNRIGYLKAFSGSDGTNLMSDYVWYQANSNSSTHPVGTKLPNELGIYDMSGNVLEFTADEYAPYPEGTIIDYGYSGIGSIVIRGGSAYGSPEESIEIAAVSSRKYSFHVTDKGNGVGFRVVRN